MGRIPTGHRKYQLRMIQPQHREMLRRLSVGEKAINIAKDMGFSPVSVSIAKNSECAKEVMKQMEEKRDEHVLAAKNRMAELSDKAVDILSEVLHNDDVGINTRINAAKYVIGSTGVEAPKKVQGEITTKIVDADMLREIKKTALEMAAEAGIMPARAIGEG